MLLGHVVTWVSHPEAVERSYPPHQGIELGNLWGDLPPRVPIGSSKDRIHSESHPLDINISDVIGAVLILVLAVEKKPDKKQLKGDGVYLVHDSRSVTVGKPRQELKAASHFISKGSERLNASMVRAQS